ncbi:unnamed protein product [Mytilus edulis]|uniref:B box-type domain-containing protein n=1 Tax=Mytilus edulis TaxID=6550 RepID=A0A8S3VIY9_MYTED|nr:unnamed protein product [Mytilus edulis]
MSPNHQQCGAPECDEGLCGDCKEHHSISKSTRDHDTVPIDDYQNLPTEVLQVAQSCRKHNQKYQIFCKKHDCPCCKKCVVEEHNECKDIVDIDDVLHNVKSSNAFNEIELTLSSMVEYIERVKKDREEHLLSIKDQKEQIETKILQAREAINNHLDFLQQTLIEALNLTIDKENKNIQQFLKSVEKNEKTIKEYQSNLIKIKQHASELQTFLTLKHMEHDIAKKEEFIQSINKSGSLSGHHFSLNIDTTLKKLASNVKMFGEVVKETTPNDVPFVKKNDKQAQLMIRVPAKSIDNLALTLVQSINTYSRDVRGCTILPDGRMVFTCYSQGCVTVVNQNGTKDFTIKQGNAFDVLYLADNVITVTFGYYSSDIHLVDINLKTTKKILNVGSRNDGIAVVDKNLIYCGRAEGLKKISLRDDSVSTIIYSKLSDWSYVTTFNDTIIYTDPDKDTVTCASVRGQVKWNFNGENILKYPLGISVDNDGNVYVIGRDSCNVVVISPDGQRHRQILSTRDGLTNPSVVHYDSLTNKLLVASFKKKGIIV